MFTYFFLLLITCTAMPCDSCLIMTDVMFPTSRGLFMGSWLSTCMCVPGCFYSWNRVGGRWSVIPGNRGKAALSKVVVKLVAPAQVPTEIPQLSGYPPFPTMAAHAQDLTLHHGGLLGLRI